MEVTMTDGAKRVRKHREKMKAAGLKPVTIWVPDVNAPGYKEQLARDIAIINADADSMLVMEQMLSVADFSDWV
jgi:AmiR/NasT family two-component response regulator